MAHTWPTRTAASHVTSSTKHSGPLPKCYPSIIAGHGGFKSLFVLRLSHLSFWCFVLGGTSLIEFGSRQGPNPFSPLYILGCGREVGATPSETLRPPGASVIPALKISQATST